MNKKTELVKDNLINEKLCYGALKKVFQENAYGGIELNALLTSLPPDANSSYITKLFYGVLEKNIEFDFVLKKFAPKTPKPSVAILLKMGLYFIKYMDIPSYAAVNKIVELCKSIGKEGISGFVNAFLRKCENYNGEDLNGDELLSYKSSYPVWLVGMIKKEYGEPFFLDLVGCKLEEKTHIRPNLAKMTYARMQEKCPDAVPDEYKLGYYVTHDTIIKLHKEEFVVQSLASMLAVAAYSEHLDNSKEVLDTCAAPGGKSVYLKQLTNAKITACDIHEHRKELIKKYAHKYSVEIDVKLLDATIDFPDFNEKFDVVICDVPCSGIGVISSKPDILLNRTPESISQLCEIQRKIIKTASKYVKEGGYLYYSTCTILKRENESIIASFLKDSKEFKLDPIIVDRFKQNDGMIHFFPHVDNIDGFFISKMIKERK